ncbi:unnamed protein product [Spirodela intermedia]|uniref:Core Histone H2A/H2B/H3 domain-containing protein n=2 Tax=Spirodela intermedia TaxID=51605 RepID=A0A7I8JK69_SPIIN|nr:unnamed protein product [Spirodela intermedia]CAA6669842.1 unnamed protein product [Spirodela intermedia]CAA7406812.1 unnamed protein product [Spirodela intermedia]
MDPIRSSFPTSVPADGLQQPDGDNYLAPAESLEPVYFDRLLDLPGVPPASQDNCQTVQPSYAHCLSPQVPLLEINPLNAATDMSEADFNTQLLNITRNRLQLFWECRLLELNDSSVVHEHLLPFSTIRKIMKQNAEVQMISSVTPRVFSKACEFFIMEMTVRAWLRAQAWVYLQGDGYGFLVDMLRSSRPDS